MSWPKRVTRGARPPATILACATSKERALLTTKPEQKISSSEPATEGMPPLATTWESSFRREAAFLATQDGCLLQGERWFARSVADGTSCSPDRALSWTRRPPALGAVVPTLALELAPTRVTTSYVTGIVLPVDGGLSFASL